MSFQLLRYAFCSIIILLVSGQSAGAQTCAADLNDDGIIDGKDLAIVLSAWGGCPIVIQSAVPLEGSVLGGTVITITGHGLATTTAVTVGGVPCTDLTVVSSREIRATTPAGEVGAAEIVVTAAGGTETAPSEFTYMQQTVASIVPTEGYYRGGRQVTISGSYLGGTTEVTFGGVPATSLEVVDANTVRVVTPPGTVGMVDVVVTGTKGTVTVPGGFEYVPILLPAWATLLEAAPDPLVVHDATLRAAIIATECAWRVRDIMTQVEMVLIPPGTFEMGCSPTVNFACDPDETPVHQVTLTQAYYMGRYELTQAQWQSQMGSNPSWFTSPSAEVPTDQVDNRPVERVSWNDIQGFLGVTGMRLPTEAEWEYACRAGTETAFHAMPGYPDGTSIDSLLGDVAWFVSNSTGQTRPVGQKAGNTFGLHDTLGNVWERVADWYGDYPDGSQTDPAGPDSGIYRVYRGGSWDTGAHDVRTSCRSYSPGVTSSRVGFRVARDP